MDAETSPAALLDPLPGIFNAGFLSLLSGASGIGKTALIAELARRFRDQAPVLGRDPNPVPGIGYITADRPWADSRQWFDAVGFPEIAHYSLVEDRDFKLEVLTNRQTKMRGAPLLEACIATLALPPGSLIFVDPIALFLGGDLLNYYTVAVSCMQIHRGLMDTHHTIVGICHTAKQKADTKDRYLRAQDRISGSGALLGFTATQMNLMGPDEAGNDDGTYHFFVNPHHLASFTYALTKDPHTGLFVFPDAPPVPSVVPLADLDEELQTLYASLPDPPAPISTRTLVELFSDRHASRATMFRNIKRLATAGFVAHVRKGAWMKVPHV